MAVLTCNNLTKYFDHTLALDHVNLEIQPGRIVGLLGPNGSGKTTLIKLANGLLTPSSGELRIDGQLPSPATRELVSYLPERPYLADWMTVSQLLDFFCDFYANFDRGAAEKMLMALQISPKLRIKQMSKGTREKVQLILVMSRRARLYLLDEPIGGVDPAQLAARSGRDDGLLCPAGARRCNSHRGALRRGVLRRDVPLAEKAAEPAIKRTDDRAALSRAAVSLSVRRFKSGGGGRAFPA